MKKILQVLLYALALLIAREVVDWALAMLNAPDWTYWIPLIAVFLGWFIGANIILFRKDKPKSTEKVEPPGNVLP